LLGGVPGGGVTPAEAGLLISLAVLALGFVVGGWVAFGGNGGMNDLGSRRKEEKKEAARHGR
jgi:hypothetical protein